MLIMVLSDHVTYAPLQGCYIARVPDDATDEEISELLIKDHNGDILEIITVFGMFDHLQPANEDAEDESQE